MERRGDRSRRSRRGRLAGAVLTFFLGDRIGVAGYWLVSRRIRAESRAGNGGPI